MIPACGPPNNLSDEKVTISAPSASVWRAPGSPISQLGGPLSSQKQFSSNNPDPISATRGTPRSVNSLISADSVKPTIL